MDYPRSTRSTLFDQAVAALQSELDTRLQQLHSRKPAIGRLEALEQYLKAIGWRARADVATHQHAGAILRLWVNVTSQVELTGLLLDLARDNVEVARKEFQDYADTIGYELTLGVGRDRVLMRVAVPSRAPAKAVA